MLIENPDWPRPTHISQNVKMTFWECSSASRGYRCANITLKWNIIPDRAKIILLADEGLSNDVIAARLDTPRQIVSKWRKRFALARLPGLEAQPRGGRKARFSPQSRRSR